jgi:23S rRNA (uracil1939-C5)-methyltransferase
MLYIRRVRKGERLSLRITRLDPEGAGLADLHDNQVHVAGALPGEEVDAVVEHRSPHRPEAWARLQKVVTPSPSRVAPACAAFGQCGGCVLGHASYPAQLEWKRQSVVAALAGPRLGHITVAACIPSPRPLGYRNRAKFVYGRRGGAAIVLGAYAPRSHTLVDLAGCGVVERPIDELAAWLLEQLSEARVPPYDEALHEGVLRNVALRVNHAGQVQLTLVTRVDHWPAGVTLAERFLTERKELVGVAQNVQPARTNAIFGPVTRALAGDPFLIERVGGVELRLSPTSFFQLNRDIAAQIYADILASTELTGTERVIDCYSGAGGVALTLAPRAAEVIGVESNPEAVVDATASAQRNHATRVRFVAGDVAEVLGATDAADVVVLNPPRRGCEPAVLEAVARLKPQRVVYVSCSPESLARDLLLLEDLGLVANVAEPYDMLPQTPHVETVVHLGPRS